jgi:hypothetical protein
MSITREAIAFGAGGPFLANCLLVGAAGLAKLRAPEPLGRAIDAAHVPVPVSSATAARAVAASELVLAAAGVFAGRAGVVAMLAVNASILAFAIALRLRAPNVDCGCLGTTSSGAGTSVAHLVVAATMLGSSAVLWLSGRSLAFDGPATANVGTIVLAAVLAWLLANVIALGGATTATPAAVRDFGPPQRGAR